MLKVYDMTSGKLISNSQDEAYGDEVLYSEWQPIVKDFMEIRLQLVESEPAKNREKPISDDLTDVDCESFINSQSKK